MAISLAHILPEAVEQYDHYTEDEEIEDPFALPYIMLFVGYALILLVEQVAADPHHDIGKKQVEAKPEGKPEGKPEVKPEAKSEVQQENKAQQKGRQLQCFS